VAGIVYCNRHGLASLLPLCKHLLQNIQLGIKPEKVIRVSYLYGNFFGEPGCPVELTFEYCPRCAIKYDLPSESCNLLAPEKDFVLNEALDGICSKCYTEVMKM
jgi:hypothetical protein